jgi:HlyD family secretion protein
MRSIHGTAFAYGIVHMDREIAAGVRTKKSVRRVATVLIAAAAIIFLFAATVSWLKPSVARRDIQIARVTRGSVDAVLQASGTIVPENEGVISSPVEARVLRIGHRAGDILHTGDEILTLDTVATHLELERLRNRVAERENDLEQLKLKNTDAIALLDAQIEQKKLDVEILRFKAEQNKKLADAGLASTQDNLAAATSVKKAAIELTQLTAAAVRAHTTANAQVAAIEIDLRTLRNERDESQRQLDLAMARSDRNGVLTWVVPEVGAMVRRGDVIARVADLSAFRVVATISDAHAATLAAGMPARVRVDDTTVLNGTVTSVEPRIENGVAKFIVALDGRNHPKLRNNLRADVFVITGRKSEVLQVRRGALTEAGNDSLFIVRGNVAVRTPARLGLIGEESVEILSGVAEGDDVVISNMSDYEKVKEVKIR